MRRARSSFGSEITVTSSLAASSVNVAGNRVEDHENRKLERCFRQRSMTGIPSNRIGAKRLIAPWAAFLSGPGCGYVSIRLRIARKYQRRQQRHRDNFISVIRGVMR